MTAVRFEQVKKIVPAVQKPETPSTTAVNLPDSMQIVNVLLGVLLLILLSSVVMHFL